MRPESGDAAHLADMLHACDLVARFVREKTLADYRGDDLLRSAVERQVEIVGEAARRLSEDFRANNAHVPWRAVIAQRHILAHEYGEIEDDLIWRVATHHVPALAAQLRPLLPPS